MPADRTTTLYIDLYIDIIAIIVNNETRSKSLALISIFYSFIFHVPLVTNIVCSFV